MSQEINHQHNLEEVRHRLSQKAVDEFKAIVRDEFRIELTDSAAEQQAVEVLELFWWLFQEYAHRE